MSGVSPALLASLIWLSTAPPSGDGTTDDPPPDPGDVDGGDAAPGPDGEAGPDAKPPAKKFETAPDANANLPRDERNDPILPYGDTPPPTEIEYADETPPPPELEYADETPPPPNLDYDQTRQRVPPEDEALERESDLEDGLTEEEFQGRQPSPQRFAIEIKFGPYLPDVDRNYTGSGFGPYAAIYGKTDSNGVTIGQPKRGVYSVLSFEWQFFNAAGPISIGTTLGLFRDTANAIIAEPVPDGDYTRSSADKTSFTVIPITLLLGYRFELLADRFRIPLVPYARAGIAHGFWVEKKGKKLTTNDAGEQSRGGSWGWQANLGLMLRLDFIERATSVDLDRFTGINHTYVFGEYQFSRLNNFGANTAMSVGADTFMIGLAAEF